MKPEPGIVDTVLASAELPNLAPIRTSAWLPLPFPNDLSRTEPGSLVIVATNTRSRGCRGKF